MMYDIHMTTRRYLLISLATGVGIIGITFAGPGFAQTVPLSCSTQTPVVGVNQTAVFTATGGNGSYVWSGQNLSLNNPTGTQFLVNYPSAGSYVITVSSGGSSANCALTVTAPAYVAPALPNTGGGYDR